MRITLPPWHWFVPPRHWFASSPEDKPEEPDDAANDDLDDSSGSSGSRITTVGAWCGAAALRRPVRALDFAVAHGINRVDIIINDHSRWRDPHDFTMRKRKQIEELAGKAAMRGIEVHLMSWIMPHTQYIVRAAELIIPLCQAAGIKSVVWDAEEPWTRAKHRAMSYVRAAELIRDRFEGLPCPMGVTGIGYAPVSKLGPLAKVCDYVIPQAYSTRSSGLKPSTAPIKFSKRWATKFDRPVTLGLAAYRQKGIKGHSASSAILAAADAAATCGDTVVYWSLAAIQRSPDIARAIASIRHRPLAIKGQPTP